MPESAKELKRYIDGLGKPLAAVIVSYHGAGLAPYKGIPIYASKAATEFAGDGRGAALFENFAKGFPGFDPTVIVPDHVLEGPNAPRGLDRPGPPHQPGTDEPEGRGERAQPRNRRTDQDAHPAEAAAGPCSQNQGRVEAASLHPPRNPPKFTGT